MLRQAVALLTATTLAACGEKEEPTAAAPAPTPSPLLSQLREGGHVLLLRHATTEPKTDRVETLNCATQRRLTRDGVAQAKAIGADIKALQIPIGEVRTSPFCRAKETAEGAFETVTVDRSLLPLASVGTDADDRRRTRALKRALVTPPPMGTNIVLVTHTPNIGAATDLSLDEGETAIFKPAASSGTRLVARMPADGWKKLRPPGEAPAPADR